MSNTGGEKKADKDYTDEAEEYADIVVEVSQRII